MPFDALERAVAKLQQAASSTNLNHAEIFEAQKEILDAPDRVAADQDWDLERIGGVYEIEHMVSGRFLDAFEGGQHSVITRE